MGSHLEHFGGSWGRSLQKGPKYKNEHHYGVLATNWGLGGSWGVYLEALGGYFGRSWSQVGLTWAILASSWELLGNMLGTRWPKMANLMEKVNDRRSRRGLPVPRATGARLPWDKNLTGFGKGFDTRLKHALLTATRGRRIYRRRLRRVPPAPFFPAWPFRSASFGSP